MTEEKKRAFRVERREFQTGQTIATAGEFTGKHPEKGKRAEEILESSRPNEKPQRTACLMVFEDEAPARRHWAKMKGGKLYEVEIERGAILHRADMRLVDEIGESVSDCDKAKVLADRYWRGDMTESPIVEILLADARVIRLISGDDAERRNEFRPVFEIKRFEPDDADEDWNDFLQSFGEPEPRREG